MSVPVELAFALVVLAWGFADYLFPRTLLQIQSNLLNYPPEPGDSLARHKRRVGLVCILAGLVAVIVALG